MSPFGDRRGRRRSRFEDERLHVSLEQMGGSRKALRSGADDNDRLYSLLHVLMIIDAFILCDVSTDVNA